MNTTLKTAIQSVVDDMVQNSQMFTAHDVTLEARKSQRAQHHEVKELVHDYYSRGGMGIAYTRTNITVPAGGTPYLYHRLVDDPNSYQNIRGAGMVPNPSVQTISIPHPSAISSVTNDDDDDDDDNSVPTALMAHGKGAGRALNLNRTADRLPDARQTLSVPAKLVRDAGFKALQTAYVSVVGDKVEVSPTASQGSKKYTVDSCYQVRITNGVFKAAGINGATYDFSQAGDKIVISKH